MFNHIPFNYNTHISHIFCSPKTSANLWLGDQLSAKDLEMLKKFDITAIISASDTFKMIYPESLSIQHKIFKIPDMPSFQIRQCFGESNKFIQQNLQKGKNVLVHCSAGISRSATLALAYLLKKLHFDLKSALAYLKSRRSIVNPNYGFIEQLKMYEQEIESKKKTREKTQKTQKNIKKSMQTNNNNQIHLLLNQKEESSKQIYGFQRNQFQGLGRNNRYTESATSNYHSLNSKLQKIKANPKPNLLIDNTLQLGKFDDKKLNISIKNENLRKRVNTENTLLFPRILLIKRQRNGEQKQSSI